jgi:hypothetical protein
MGWPGVWVAAACCWGLALCLVHPLPWGGRATEVGPLLGPGSGLQRKGVMETGGWPCSTCSHARRLHGSNRAAVRWPAAAHMRTCGRLAAAACTCVDGCALLCCAACASAVPGRHAPQHVQRVL